jgi:protocatechuate 3,4-dioxygenase beta subunit
MNLLLIALAALVSGVQAQPQRASASIEGIVVKLGTGEPLAGASVQLKIESPDEQLQSSELRARAQFHRTATSDGSGRFIFENAAAGQYRLIATYEGGGYVPVEYGQRSPTGQGIPFEIAAGQKMTGIQLAMSPTGSISGRVYDRNGEPLGKAQVLALRPVYKNGRRTMTIVQSVESDDRGEYRLYWLAPGRYFVGARPDVAEPPANIGPPSFYNTGAVRVTPPARFGTFEQATNPVVHKRRSKNGDVVEEMYLPVYYPNTIDMHAAAPVSVAGGATTAGVDIATAAGLITPHHIRGRVFDPAGQPVGATQITAIPRTADPYFAAPRAQSAADGTFDIAGVAPGSYRIFASSASESRSLNGIGTVEVAEKDVQNIPIGMTSSFKLSGRFVMDGSTRSGNNSQTSFPRLGSLLRDPEVLGLFSGFPSFNLADADGSFTIDGIVPGDFRLTFRLAPENYVKSMRTGNADVLNDGLHISGPPDTMLEVVLGGNAGRIEGSVVNTRNEPLSNRTVVLVPDIRLRQRSDLYRVVSTDNAGRFRMQGITPGDYKLFAWENVETGAWQAPEFIQAYENAGRAIRINEGSNESLQLPVIP